MIQKFTGRLRLLVLVCALIGAMIGTVGKRSASFAQGDGYFCPPEYQTCSSDWSAFDENDPFGDGTYTGGTGTTPCDNAGGQWVCPNPKISGDSSTGSGSCNSNGCKLYNGQGPWVCNYIPSDKNTTCPPLQQCECR